MTRVVPDVALHRFICRNLAALAEACRLASEQQHTAAEAEQLSNPALARAQAKSAKRFCVMEAALREFSRTRRGLTERELSNEV